MKLYIFLILLFGMNTVAIGQENDLYALSWGTDGYIAAGATSLIVADFFLNRSIPILSKSDIAALDRNNVIGFDRSAIDNYSGNAANISDLCKNVAPFIPFTLFLSGRARSDAGVIGLIYLEVIGLSYSITTGFKAVVRRKRPYVYNTEVPLGDKQKRNASKSFFSGHTSFVAGISFFSASVFSDYYPDSQYKPFVWSGAICISALTAYTRYAAGRHFPSDVVIGYGVGALIGYYIPRLHKLQKKTELSIAPSASGIYLSLKF